MSFSLSDVYEPGAVYAPLYPFGTHPVHGFHNTAAGDEPLTLIPIFSDPLLTVAGDGIDVVSFSSPRGADTRRRLRECFGTPYPPEHRARLIPALTSSEGELLDAHIVGHLRALTRARTLLVSQPFFDSALEPHYRLDPALSHRLNDKANLPELVPEEFLPQRLATYGDGASFSSDTAAFPCPCIVKIASSSSGSGVRIVRAPSDLDAARTAFAGWKGTILVEEYIAEGRNIGVQFAVPADPAEPPRVLGAARQIVDDDGHFLGNRIERDYVLPDVSARVFEQVILPRARALGWHGIGGMDAIDTGSGLKCIDPNFRSTAATPHLYHRLNGVVRSPALTFFGTFRGRLRDLQRRARMGDTDQVLYVLAAHEEDEHTLLIGGVLHEDEDHLRQNVDLLVSMGVSSAGFPTRI